MFSILESIIFWYDKNYRPNFDVYNIKKSILWWDCLVMWALEPSQNLISGSLWSEKHISRRMQRFNLYNLEHTFQKIYSRWSHLWCRRRRSRRRRAQSSLRTRGTRLQNCLHIKTFPYPISHRSRPGRHQCSPWKYAQWWLEMARLWHSQGKWLAWRSRRHPLHVQGSTRSHLWTIILRSSIL